jgi:hypothetical protein
MTKAGRNQQEDPQPQAVPISHTGKERKRQEVEAGKDNLPEDMTQDRPNHPVRRAPQRLLPHRIRLNAT